MGATADPYRAAEAGGSRADVASRSARIVDSPWSAGWIVSPRFDLLFLANVWWLLAWVPGFVASEGTPHVEFWQIYFLTTPHRWITLILVATDPDRRGGRTILFATLAIAAGALVCGVWLFTGAFLCLLLVDYVWNAWHFAAQHAGVLRMYSRKHGGGRPRTETWCVRVFVFYVIVRLAGWSTGWIEDFPSAQQWLFLADVAIVALPLLLLLLEAVDHPWRRPGKVAFLASISGMYGALLWATMSDQRTIILALVAASAAFHAVEYLAVVSQYAWRRQRHGSAGLFREVTRQWLLVLAAYVIVFGLVATMTEGWAPEFWLGLNLWAAFLHYAFDGMIWKLRRPETSTALGVEIPTQSGCEVSHAMPRATVNAAALNKNVNIT